mgnify:CR=1 FL=1
MTPRSLANTGEQVHDDQIMAFFCPTRVGAAVRATGWDVGEEMERLVELARNGSGKTSIDAMKRIREIAREVAELNGMITTATATESGGPDIQPPSIGGAAKPFEGLDGKLYEGGPPPAATCATSRCAARRSVARRTAPVVDRAICISLLSASATAEASYPSAQMRRFLYQRHTT